VAIITADHGNADEMYEINAKTGEPKHKANGEFCAKTSHTLNPVPCIFHSNHLKDSISLAELEQPGLSNLAATIVNLLGYKAPLMWDRGLLIFK
jgi:2,3-bisphosphoglycerate-independent phosphoglycerate mutase